ncbi:hypothetical protein BDI4_830016 [Burkholderia diffusa]|nr:hypothetical protein BDI4_830016 [Burkholderia diffusa]
MGAHNREQGACGRKQNRDCSGACRPHIAATSFIEKFLHCHPAVEYRWGSFRFRCPKPECYCYEAEDSGTDLHPKRNLLRCHHVFPVWPAPRAREFSDFS